MASITTVWTLSEFNKLADFVGLDSELTTMTDGGFVASIRGPTSQLVMWFDESGDTINSFLVPNATNLDLTQSSNGNVVLAYEKANETFRMECTQDGIVVVPETPFGGPGSSAPSESECGARVWQEYDPDQYEEEIRLEIHVGILPVEIEVTSTEDTYSVRPSVKCLPNGNYVVAWYDLTEGLNQPEIHFAVYDDLGNLVGSGEIDSTVVDTPSIDIFTTQSGGFGIGFIGDGRQLRAEGFDASGNPDYNWAAPTLEELGNLSIDQYPVGGSLGSFALALPPVTIELPSGAIAAAFSGEQTGSTGFDVRINLVDPVTGAPIVQAPLIAASDLTAVSDVEIAALGNGAGMAVTYVTPQGAVLGTVDLIATTYATGLDDDVTGGDQIDVINGYAGNDDLDGGDGDDRIDLGLGDDTADGGAGIDTLIYTGANDVHIELRLTGAQNTGLNGTDTIRNFENLDSGRGDDELWGNALANHIRGGDGDDLIRGLEGMDIIEGGGGNDDLFGGTDDDLLFGGLGNDDIDGNIHGANGDTASYADIKAGVTIDLRIVTAQNTGGGGLDRLFQIEHLIGTRSHDSLIGNSATRNDLFGGDGNDTLDGGLGVDRLFGQAGFDVLLGGDANDQLTGGADRDVLTGGTGADRFIYALISDSGRGAASDKIMDFSSADGDKIDLSALPGTLSFIGGDTFNGVAREVRMQETPNLQLIQVDLTGDGVSDMDIRVMNKGVTGAGDFLL